MSEDQQQPINGYLTASQGITSAINQAITQGVTIDEIYAALRVQLEVINLRLTQVIYENQQRDLAKQAQAQEPAAE